MKKTKEKSNKVKVTFLMSTNSNYYHEIREVEQSKAIELINKGIVILCTN